MLTDGLRGSIESPDLNMQLFFYRKSESGRCESVWNDLNQVGNLGKKRDETCLGRQLNPSLKL